MRPVKNKTLEKLFVKVFNRLLTDRSAITSHLNLIKEENKSSICGVELMRINKEIDEVLKEEHVMLELIEKDSIDKFILKAEHEAIIERIGDLRKRRISKLQEIENQDKRLQRTDELINILDSTEMPIVEFDGDLFETIVDKLIVKERECIVFYFKNGMQMEEWYEFKRGEDNL